MTTIYIGGAPGAAYGNCWHLISSTNSADFHVSENMASYHSKCRVTNIVVTIMKESLEGRLLQEVINGSSKRAVAECVTKLVMNNASAVQLEEAVDSLKLASYQQGKRDLRNDFQNLLGI